MLVRKRRPDLLREIWQEQKKYTYSYVQGVMLASVVGIVKGLFSQRGNLLFIMGIVAFVAGAVVLQELDYRKGKGEKDS